MRRATLVLLALVLIVGAAAPVAAQAPRVERLENGFTVVVRK